MHTHPSPIAARPIAGAFLLAMILIVVWAAAPDVPVVLLLLAVLFAEVVIDGAMYVLQRRRHW